MTAGVLQSSSVAKAWAPYGIEPPAPSVIAACRRVAADEVIVRIVNRLGFEHQLAQYTADTTALVQLVALFGGSPSRKAVA